MTFTETSLWYYLNRVIVVGVLLTVILAPITHIFYDISYLFDFVKYGSLKLALLGLLRYSISTENQSYNIYSTTASYFGGNSGRGGNHNPLITPGESGGLDHSIISYLTYGGGILFVLLLVIDWLV